MASARLFMALRLVIVLLWGCGNRSVVSAFSASTDAAQQARNHLVQAFSSLAGKLTFSPEVMIPEPSDPTALLLQTNAIQTLSQRLRSAKANTVFLQTNSMTAIQTFCHEQEQARGNFPGPVPVVYCKSSAAAESSPLTAETLAELAETGVDGAVVPVCGGATVQTLDEIGGGADKSNWKELCVAALENGIQPIPEVTVEETTAAAWNEAELEALVASVSTAEDESPVAVLLNILPVAREEDEDDAETSSSDDETTLQLPTVPKALGKKTPILGSVRATAGDNRINIESQRFKQAGFTGALLRSDCVPGFRMQPDLEIVGGFWAACINDLKSTKSKSFSFRSKNNMEESNMSKWAKYQKGVLDSGALGDPNDSYSIVDEAAGEYKGFV